MILWRLFFLFDPGLHVQHLFALLDHLPETHLLLLLRQDGALRHSGGLAQPETAFFALPAICDSDDAIVAA
jgi:hypothetical protein